MDTSSDCRRFQHQMFLSQPLSQYTLFVHKYNYRLFWQELGVFASSRKSASNKNYKFNPVGKHFYEYQDSLFKTHRVTENRKVKS